jgi:predicted phosphodiesterase
MAAPSKARKSDALWRRALRVALPLALVVVVVAASSALLAPATYRVPTGSVDFRLEPAWPGGRLVLPLGPAGMLTLRSHRAPVDVVVDYRVSADVTSFEDAERVVEELPEVQASARDAFTRFLWSRLAPWLLLGAAAGALVAAAWRAPRVTRRRGWRRIAVGAGFGLAAAGVVGGAVAGLALATVDETPEAEYSGLATNVPRLLPLVRELQATEGGGMSRLQAYVDGLEIVAEQLAGDGERPSRESVTRLLVVSDVHMNAYGARLASRLAAGEGTPVDAVVLAGDLTNYGTRYEARYFIERFDAAGASVFMVGGNHEDAPAMAAFARAGYTVLESELAGVGGVTVYGVSDPVAYDATVASDVEALSDQSAALAESVQGLAAVPEVLAVHDVRQAEGVVDWAVEGDVPLTVVYGNDHVPAVTTDGTVVLVDAGTGGASGYEQIGAQRGDWYTFVLLDFARDGEGGLVAVTTLAYSVDGRSRVEYLPMVE